MTYIAIQEAQDGTTVDWLEQVSNEQYSTNESKPAVQGPAQPSAAQRLFGDVAPKLAQLTDDVLFADVWARPGLSRHDRSLVTVSALIAMNRPDQLRSHMPLARQSGVTDAEVVEALTHLAFLCRLARCRDGRRGSARSLQRQAVVMKAGPFCALARLCSKEPTCKK